MKKLLTIFFSFLSMSAFANTSAFDMSLGKSTKVEIEKNHKLREIKNNDGYHQYIISPKEINFEGISDFYITLNKNQTLVGVQAEFHKNKFEYLYSILEKKYQLEHNHLPFSETTKKWHKSALFKTEDSKIILIHRNPRSNVRLIYLTNDLYNFEMQKIQNKKQNESSKL